MIKPTESQHKVSNTKSVNKTLAILSTFSEETILGLEHVSIEDSSTLMSAADVVVATGEPSMVKAGRYAPEDKCMGHAGAIVSGGMGTVKSKIEGQGNFSPAFY